MVGTTHAYDLDGEGGGGPTIFMEPLFYNANMVGWWGSKIIDPPDWEVKDREAHSKASLGRWSKDRCARADVMFKTTKRFARAGITHVCDLLKGTQAGEELKM